MNQEQSRHFALAGTVSFPATFPRLAEITLRPSGSCLLLVATEQSSPRVTIRRCTPIADVRGVFIPHDLNSVNYNHGDWLTGNDVLTGVQLFINRGRPLYGIVYVAEHTATLLEVSAGMTAAESSQYYPPLPVDRSVNHYDPFRGFKTPPVAPSPCEGALGEHAVGAWGSEGSVLRPCEDPVGTPAPSPCEGVEFMCVPQPCEGVEAVYRTLGSTPPSPCEGM